MTNKAREYQNDVQQKLQALKTKMRGEYSNMENQYKVWWNNQKEEVNIWIRMKVESFVLSFIK